MSSRVPITPEPSGPKALKSGDWVKIKQQTDEMVAKGFGIGTIVQIYKVKDANTTPEQNKWKGLITDTQYAIQRKDVGYDVAKMSSPESGNHMVPHRLLRERERATTEPSERLKHAQEVWLSEQCSFPFKGGFKTAPKGPVKIKLGPVSTKGSLKSQGSDSKFWFYQIEWLVRTPKVEMKSYGAWVPAQMFASMAESREPVDPKLQ